MKVAIAGTGHVAQYLLEELTSYGHNVVILTRKTKTDIKVEQRETDYSVTSLLTVLEDREALISTFADYANPSISTKVTLDMLEACTQSTHCKTFLPSEYTLNVEDYPEQPMFLEEANRTLHSALTASTGIRWTIISNSWFAEYILPASQRHLRDIYPIWPMDHTSKEFIIFGPGTQLFDIASVRDVAKAIALLLDSPTPWEPYTYLSGEQITWNDLFALLEKRDEAWTSRTKPLADTIKDITSGDPDRVLAANFEIESYAGALILPKEKVQRHREKYFAGLKFRGVEQILDEAAERMGEII